MFHSYSKILLCLILAVTAIPVSSQVNLPDPAEEVVPSHVLDKLQVVDVNGNPVHEGLQTNSRFVIEGIVLNNPWTFNNEGEDSYILFLQNGLRGIEIYSGESYGGGYMFYKDLQPGMCVTITGLLENKRGKTIIGERQNANNAFTIEVGNCLVEPVVTELASLAGLEVFAANRKSGGELYEGNLVELQNVTIVSGNWENGGTITVADAEGNTFPVELRYNTRIGEHEQPEGRLNITGIFNQVDDTPPYKEGYVLWPRSIKDFEVIKDGNVINVGQTEVKSWKTLKTSDPR